MCCHPVFRNCLENSFAQVLLKGKRKKESNEGGKTHTLQRVWRPPLSCAYILKIPLASEHS